mmetsp:Transcript_44414/g.117402  ORF Transcript_44414/g.117402 Transcript_44414/m.117402 type:complete len:360 (-) Transcript_44414:4-1083(-)
MTRPPNGERRVRRWSCSHHALHPQALIADLHLQALVPQRHGVRHLHLHNTGLPPQGLLRRRGLFFPQQVPLLLLLRCHDPPQVPVHVVVVVALEFEPVLLQAVFRPVDDAELRPVAGGLFVLLFCAQAGLRFSARVRLAVHLLDIRVLLHLHPLVLHRRALVLHLRQLVLGAELEVVLLAHGRNAEFAHQVAELRLVFALRDGLGVDDDVVGEADLVLLVEVLHWRADTERYPDTLRVLLHVGQRLEMRLFHKFRGHQVDEHLLTGGVLDGLHHEPGDGLDGDAALAVYLVQHRPPRPAELGRELRGVHPLRQQALILLEVLLEPGLVPGLAHQPGEGTGAGVDLPAQAAAPESTGKHG